MPYVLKPSKIFVKNPEGVGYLPQNVIADETTEEIIDRIEDAKASMMAQVDQALAESQSAADGIEAQKDTMIASIASIAGQGVDTTLTQSGVAADAKATGDAVDDLKSALDADTLVQGYASTISSSNYGTLLPDYDNAEVNRIYQINGVANQITNAPDNSAHGTLFTFARGEVTSHAWYVQLFAGYSKKLYWRAKWGSAWTPWKEFADRQEIEESSKIVQGSAAAIIASNYATLLPDYNDAEVNRIYRVNGVANSIAHAPDNESTSLTLVTLADTSIQNKSWYLQMASTVNNELYWRGCWNGTWADWKKTIDKQYVDDNYIANVSDTVIQGYNTIISSSNYETLLSDYNNAEVNRIYQINSVANQIANAPDDSSHATLITFARGETSTHGWYVQLYAGYNQDLYWRSCWSSTSTIRWSAWKQITDQQAIITAVGSDKIVQGFESAITSSNYATLLPDYNNAAVNRIYRVSGIANSISHAPDSDSTSLTLITLADTAIGNKSWYLQIASTHKHRVYWRACWGGTWEAWKQAVDKEYVDAAVAEGGSAEINKGINLKANYFAGTCVNKKEISLASGDYVLFYGDSITHGVTKDGVQYPPWVNEFCTKLGLNAYNKAVSGAVYGHSASDRPSEYWISTQMGNTTASEWSNAKLIFVAAGTNDAGYNIAPSETAQYVQTAIDTIRQNAPATPVVFITPIRRGSASADQNANEVNLKLPYLSGIITNIALENDCNVICGLDFPLPTYSIDELIDNFTIDGLHPNLIGAKVYARAVMNALF